MNISISPEQATFLDQQVAGGAFASPQEAVAAAIDLLRLRADALAKVDSGRRQLDEGDYTEYEELKQRVRNLRAV
jgi:Arc/MetJ-type ribon-helix-helix transcriptional regulator